MIAINDQFSLKKYDRTLFIDIDFTFPFVSRNASFWRERPEKSRKKSVYKSNE